MCFDIVSLIIGGLIVSAVWVVVWLFSGDDPSDDAALVQAYNTAFREGKELGYERAMSQSTNDHRAATRHAWYKGFKTAVHDARANMNYALDEMEKS